MAERNETLQTLCRDYLRRLRHIGMKYGVDVDGLIEQNRRKECEATRNEVELLSRAVDDERLSRGEVSETLGKSYRKCVKDGDFDCIQRLKRVGIYSKISVLLHKNKKS